MVYLYYNLKKKERKRGLILKEGNDKQKKKTKIIVAEIIHKI